jgi:hypothetical protein
MLRRSQQKRCPAASINKISTALHKWILDAAAATEAAVSNEYRCAYADLCCDTRGIRLSQLLNFRQR